MTAYHNGLLAPLAAAPVSGIRRARRALAERALTRLRGRALEQRLLAGDDPTVDPVLMRRAARLARAATRESTARALERILHEARRPGAPYFSAAIRPRRDEVLIAEPVLIALVDRLRDGEPIWPVGIARVRRMLVDGSGPLYVGSEHGAVRESARAALDELDDGLLRAS